MVNDNTYPGKELQPAGSGGSSNFALSDKAAKLLAEILEGNIADIRPVMDFNHELGFVYPSVESILNLKGKELVSFLESLAQEGILKKTFFDRFIHCPQCMSINLRPTVHCPKCSSGNIDRGRILEHHLCKFIGLENEFFFQGRYICPRCRQELYTIDGDYRSLGLLYKCHECAEIFSSPRFRWRCLKCFSVSAEDKVAEVTVYSYSFDEAKKSWLEFELKPKKQLIEFLKHRGYEVMENAVMKGGSGAEHLIDILATRDDGIINPSIAFDLKVNGGRVELSEVFDFDDKAYDLGIHNKILISVPDLRKEAQKYAAQQRIKILSPKDLEILLNSAQVKNIEAKREPFEFKSRQELLQYLDSYGYQVKENAVLKGKSGAEHILDILATDDNGLVAHRIAIGLVETGEPVTLGKLFEFDNKAYDIGILEKVFIALPGLTREAHQFAQRQRIKVIEIHKAESPVALK